MGPLRLNTIIQGDCLEEMRSLSDNSIDLIATDPPYFNVKGGGSGGRFEYWDRQWDTSAGFLQWIESLADQWERVLKPNGSLYCFASTKMAARVEVTLSKRFNILSNIRWRKEAGFHKGACKETLRDFFDASESIIFAEHYGADNIAKGEAGYGAKCDELRGFVFEPLRAYLDGEREKAGLTVRQVAEAFQKKTGSRTVTGMAGHWFTSVQWTLPTQENYNWLHELTGGKHFRQQYEELRQQYEELRQQYEELRRPFAVTADIPYTDIWDFPTVPPRAGKHPCEKPAKLMQHIINVSSRPGSVVLDCFAGSGATLAAAKTRDRNFIGIEIDPHWVAVANANVGQFSPLVSAATREDWLQTQTAIAPPPKQQLSLF